MKRALALGVTIVTTLVLAGCNQVNPRPSPSGGETSSATPTPTPTVEPLTLVDCETLLPLALASTVIVSDQPLVYLGEFPATDFFGFSGLPEVTAALTDSPQAKMCSWQVTNAEHGGGMRLHVAEVTPETRAAIEAALAPAGFSSAIYGPVTSYDRATEYDEGSTDETLLFTGDLWIMCNSSGGPCSDGAWFALDALRIANPTLGL